MTKQEFMSACKAGGYCQKKTAEAYIKKNNRTEYTNDDIQKVYRLEERAKEITALYCYGKYRKCGNGKTTKRINYDTKWRD